ncbi:hypothetical protein GMORB2_4332 [Geosmithia morbida]|uniref:Secreted protein n=1 Tax=Geosmithia morbida TaxID=1094350 RepID=A0A9P5D3Z3_9HYPO|nr:uncharacterized protein GMORB2_4332 [Geosmithia morbida]KAF4125492.1 hypothetical protein GMORB2_4332 [Geosmithia morbida]
MGLWFVVHDLWVVVLHLMCSSPKVPYSTGGSGQHPPSRPEQSQDDGVTAPEDKDGKLVKDQSAQPPDGLRLPRPVYQPPRHDGTPVRGDESVKTGDATDLKSQRGGEVGSDAQEDGCRLHGAPDVSYSGESWTELKSNVFGGDDLLCRATLARGQDGSVFGGGCSQPRKRLTMNGGRLPARALSIPALIPALGSTWEPSAETPES